METIKNQIEGYALVPVYGGMKYQVSFDDREIYVTISENPVNLMGNRYWAGLIVQKMHTGSEMRHEFFIRAYAAVLSNLGGENIITPIAQNADTVWQPEDVDDIISHFTREYRILREQNPEKFNERIEKLRRLNPRIVSDTEGNVRIETN